MVITISGEVIHIHYCLSSDSYSIDLHSLSDKEFDHKLCKCIKSDINVCSKSINGLCCSGPESEIALKAGCVDIKATAVTDKEYFSIVYSFQFHPTSFLIPEYTKPMVLDQYILQTESKSVDSDNSPPEIITTQVLII